MPVRNVAKLEVPAIRRAVDRHILEEIEPITLDANELNPVRLFKRRLFQVPSTRPDIDMTAVLSNELTRVWVCCNRTRLVTHDRHLSHTRPWSPPSGFHGGGALRFEYGRQRSQQPMTARPIHTGLRLAFAVAFPAAVAYYADSWWPLLSIPILLAVTMVSAKDGRAASAFTSHPWQASVVNGIGYGAFVGFFWLAIGFSRIGSLGYGGTMGIAWLFLYRYGQGPRIVERAERRFTEARSHSDRVAQA